MSSNGRERKKTGKTMNIMHKEVVMRREEERIIWIGKIENKEICFVFVFSGEMVKVKQPIIRDWPET